MIIKVIPFINKYFLSQRKGYHIISHNDVHLRLFSENIAISFIKMIVLSPVFEECLYFGCLPYTKARMTVSHSRLDSDCR